MGSLLFDPRSGRCLIGLLGRSFGFLPYPKFTPLNCFDAGSAGVGDLAFFDLPPGDCRGDVEINSLGGCFLPRKRFVLVLLELVASGRQPAWRVVLFCAGVGGLTLA